MKYVVRTLYTLRAIYIVNGSLGGSMQRTHKMVLDSTESGKADSRTMRTQKERRCTDFMWLPYQRRFSFFQHDIRPKRNVVGVRQKGSYLARR